MIVTALAALAVLPLAVVAHELTHVLAVKVLGGSARVSLWPPSVAYSLPNARKSSMQYVGLAPFFAGVLFAVLYLRWIGVPGWSDLAVVAGWSMYTLPSSLEDFSTLAQQAEITS